jgi:transposase-like protein
MQSYSQEIRETMVAKLCTPGGPGYTQLSLESGIATSTLHTWVQKYGNGAPMKKPRRPQDWSAKDKLQAVFEALKLSEQELGEYFRKHGIHSHHIEEWKSEAFASIEEVKKSRGRPALDPEVVALRAKNKELERDLNRKNKALAEQSAIIILQKKLKSLYGEPEEDE